MAVGSNSAFPHSLEARSYHPNSEAAEQNKVDGRLGGGGGCPHLDYGCGRAAVKAASLSEMDIQPDKAKIPVTTDSMNLFVQSSQTGYEPGAHPSASQA